MKHTAKLITLCAILIVSAAIGLAQKPTQKPATSARAVFKSGGDVITKDGKTELGYLPIFNNGPNSNLFLYATFVNKAIFPDLPRIDVFFISVAQGPKYANAHNISMLVDGQQFTFGSQSMDFYTIKNGEFFVEGTGVSLTYDNLERVVNANQVAVELGATSFRLGPEHLAALREVARRVKNQP